jgi:hypothetical protein
VGSAVEKAGRHVHVLVPTPLVHRTATASTASSRLSSTPVTVLDASVHGHPTPFSPASTAAKTTDENLYYWFDNDKFEHQVDCVDNPSPNGALA